MGNRCSHVMVQLTGGGRCTKCRYIVFVLRMLPAGLRVGFHLVFTFALVSLCVSSLVLAAFVAAGYIAGGQRSL